MGDLDIDVETMLKVVAEQLEDNPVVELTGEYPSLRNKTVKVRRVLVCTNPDRRVITADDADRFQRFLDGDPSAIVRCRGTKSYSHAQRKLILVREFLSDISLLEVEVADRQDCTTWLGDAGMITKPNGQEMFLKITCYCTTFWKSGRICICTVIYATKNGFLFNRLKPSQLLSELPSAKGKAGCPRLLQNHGGQSSRLQKKQKPRHTHLTPLGQKKALVQENKGTRYFQYVAVDAIPRKDDGVIIFKAARVIKCPDVGRRGNGSKSKSAPKTDYRWTLEFLDGTKQRVNWDADKLAHALLLSDNLGCGGPYHRGMTEPRVSRDDLGGKSLREHRNGFTDRIGDMIQILRREAPLRKLGWGIAHLAEDDARGVHFLFGRIVGFVRKRGLLNRSDQGRWIICMSRVNTRYLAPLTVLAELLVTWDYAKEISETGGGKLWILTLKYTSLLR